VVRRKSTRGRLSVFKGREANLNHTIFQTLAFKSPLIIYDIHKAVKARRGFRRVRYASVNKRVRSLKESSFIRRAGVKKTKAGFEASIYELTAKAYLAILLNSLNLDELVMRADEATASAILAAVTYTT